MKTFNWGKGYIKPILIITLLVALLGTFTGCEEYGFPAPTPPKETPEKAATSTTIGTKDKAIVAVHEHLLNQAESYEAKVYLADFYAACDNWSAESEIFKDGSGTWYVLVDMTKAKTWEQRPYWQQAGWFVFKDGKVMPSNRLQANALRIEADLQKLSPEPEKTEE